MTTTNDTYELEVCEDCAYAIEGLNEQEHELLTEWEGHHLALNCPEDGCESFSWSRCDGCGSQLGGTRHEAVAWGAVSA